MDKEWPQRRDWELHCCAKTQKMSKGGSGGHSGRLLPESREGPSFELTGGGYKHSGTIDGLDVSCERQKKSILVDSKALFTCLLAVCSPHPQSQCDALDDSVSSG